MGSHLCGKLLDDGHEVTSIDNLLTGSEKNIEEFMESPNFKFINHNIVHPLPEDFPVDQIYHLASPASPNKNSSKSYHAHPLETMEVNTVATWRLCELAVKKNAKLLFASTSEVYGDPLEHPQTEEYRGNVSTTGPRSIYDEAKRFGETIVAAYVRSHGLDGRIVRIFNTYGPKMALDDGRVVIEFVQAALADQPFPIFGDGEQTRSFCYVSDMISGIIAAMEKGEPGEVYNLGNAREFTIAELAQKIKDLTESKSEVKQTAELPEDDPLKRCPDITKAKEKLGWEPKIELEEGLKSLIEYLNLT